MILAIDTTSEACSVALIDGDRVVAERHEIIGRGHAERLAPMIAELPDRGKADTIIVDCGPGSFTGLRVGLAMARALGFAWQAEVYGYSALPLMAAMVFSDDDAVDRLAVTILGGHGEMFVQRFERTGLREVAPLASMTPERAIAEIEEDLLIGNAAAELVALAGQGEARDALPRAADIMLLPESYRTLAPSPIYGRAPDAKPSQ